MCGNGHYSMKGIIDVVEQEEFDMWMAKQKPQYLVNFPDKDPSISPVADSTKPVIGMATAGKKEKTNM
jgi:cytochrome c oxidase subunit 2